jgi:small subunit ribosomal protein S7
MPRRGAVERRELPPDPVYQNESVTRLINKVMRDGKKGTAQRIVYDALQIVAERSQRSAVDVVEAALRNAAPTLEVRGRRVGGSTLQVPNEVRPERRVSLAMRWLVSHARRRSERGMAARLAGELLDAAANQGAAVRQKEDIHRMAEANRAFAHYRW